ncbi:34248_t:CDS:2 [Gigaspora margarita]|uniref:34248_t:CDS:1 n=1 Tax=Gigaspora margarita TaxID=4874 RepID=A0ABN7W5I2_GIGMA|nr:34248_t:CDS:2 [Gigaspora margarita]
MALLSEKLAGITLPVDNFGSHLDSQRKVLDEDLACRNFEFAGNYLYDIWKRDKIHGKPVPVEYIDQIRHLFAEFSTSCEYRAPDAALLLDQNNGFLPPIMKAKDQHYINPIHALQYYDKLKILIYNCYCLSILRELHQRLCCNIYSKYFPSLKYITNHRQNRHSSNSSNYGYPSQNLDVCNAAEDVLQLSPQVVIEWREIQSDVKWYIFNISKSN